MAEKAKSVSVTREKAAGKTPAEAGEWGGLMPHSLGELRQEIDSLFEDFFSPDFLFGSFRRRFGRVKPYGGFEPSLQRLMPNLDVAETDKAFQITVELPGMDEKDIEIIVSDGVLKLEGEKKEEREEKNKSYYLSERRYGSVQRALALPEGVDTDKISAKFEKGVLTVDLPKSPEKQTAVKKIKIAKK
ncbi:MAG: Hsp20/alpha crystallin family protein [Alphaproteobacteria bacterium]